MPIAITWLPGAKKDVERLRNFIESENPRAAQRAAKRILEGIKILRDNPDSGIPVEDSIDFRELMLSFGAGEYIIRYRRETPSRVVIVRIRHSREQGF